ncbi:hypothetical protein A2973_02750 [Candidatus Gottesmanbacteria bacterium RIFCSPLOWO2_01_FULL_49_10]|uniref:Toxin YoeB n=1 Tax=Candidatus Gottesmanbacteria bacterium RIFCSPLOWO2_01_FULL_49_10 TaxID=1798396 RepID=A0A1F6AXM5_9BACT|nr:MAG: hypothetical protein UY10_C0004G0037 [Microgenomates group bacterium GW2011_GWA2_47_8]OGG29283.1 MAG: hypothetical protein A2973_02750 [Candidatus Gottesmanbacteria bacterium RIFCSPLOWO2_01_FULL_49_10]
MELRFTTSFEAEHKKITRGNDPLKRKIKKQLRLLLANINHPSLRLHKLASGLFWSISIDKSVRALIIIEKEWIYVYHIGKHEDVY